MVLYSYCGSMLLTGLFQLVAARHLSDRLFVRERDAVAPAYSAAALLSLVVHGAAAAVAVLFLRPPPLLASAEIALFGAVGLVSSGMIYLGVLRSFTLILAAFVAGMAVALAVSQVLAASLGLAGLVFGFAAGHGLIAAVFLSRLRAEFPSRRPWDFGLLRTALRHPALVLIGVARAARSDRQDDLLGGPWSLRSEAGLRICPLVDNGFFIASFTIVPALVLLFIRLEGSFHDKYAHFFGSPRSGADLPTIRRSRPEVVASFDATMTRMAVIQGMATFGAILLAPPLLQAFRHGLDQLLCLPDGVPGRVPADARARDPALLDPPRSLPDRGDGRPRQLPRGAVGAWGDARRDRNSSASIRRVAAPCRWWPDIRGSARCCRTWNATRSCPRSARK